MKNPYFIDFDGEQFHKPSRRTFEERVQKNFNLISNRSFPFWKYEFFDLKFGTAKNALADTLSKSINDIRASIPLGQLALYAQNGADAVMIENGKYVETELKTIEIDESKIVIGPNSELYYESLKGNRTLLSSYLCISFVVTNDYIRKSKNRPTFLVLRTKSDGNIIDAFRLSGDIIYREISKGDPQLPNKTVILKTFLEEGEKTPVKIPHLGWENWKKRMLNSARYVMRVKTIDEIKSEEVQIRADLRKDKTIELQKFEEVERQISRARRLLGRNYTAQRKLNKEQKKLNERLLKIQEEIKENSKYWVTLIGREKVIDGAIESNEKLCEVHRTKVLEINDDIQKSTKREEKRAETSKELRKLIVSA